MSDCPLISAPVFVSLYLSVVDSVCLFLSAIKYMWVLWGKKDFNLLNWKQHKFFFLIYKCFKTLQLYFDDIGNALPFRSVTTQHLLYQNKVWKCNTEKSWRSLLNRRSIQREIICFHRHEFWKNRSRFISEFVDKVFLIKMAFWSPYLNFKYSIEDIFRKKKRNQKHLKQQSKHV